MLERAREIYHYFRERERPSRDVKVNYHSYSIAKWIVIKVICLCIVENNSDLAISSKADRVSNLKANILHNLSLREKW